MVAGVVDRRQTDIGPTLTLPAASQLLTASDLP
jgi:hypothetical protein